mgnify:CR=1 FL=1
MITAPVEEIELLNKIIAYSIANGGDSGGPYFSCENDLYQILNDYIWYRNWQDGFIVKPQDVALTHDNYKAIYPNIPQIVGIE